MRSVKVNALILDPVQPDGRRLHEHHGWTDPFAALPAFAQHLNQAIGEPIYQIAQQIEIDEPPQGGLRWLLAVYNVVHGINHHFYDEIWLAGPAGSGYGEGMMVSHANDDTAYPCHDGLLKLEGEDYMYRHGPTGQDFDLPRPERRFILHGFELGNWNALEVYFHRAEAIMSHIWNDGLIWGGYCEESGPHPSAPQGWNQVHTYWTLWTLTHNCLPGQAHVGSGHFMPNSRQGYVRNDPRVVPSGAHLWLEYPSGFPLDLMRGNRSRGVAAPTWSSYPHPIVWQLQHIPRGEGLHDGRWANWWRYILDPNEEMGRGLPTTLPYRCDCPCKET